MFCFRSASPSKKPIRVDFKYEKIAAETLLRKLAGVKGITGYIRVATPLPFPET
jgi:hypothetical protein